MCQLKKPTKNALSFAAILTLLILFGVPTAEADDAADAVSRAGNVDTQLTDEVKLVDEAFYKAFSDRDIWAMAQLWSQDDRVSAIFPANDKPYFGWDDVRRGWQQSFDHNRDIKIKSLAGAIFAKEDNEGDVAWIIESTQFESVQTQTGQPVLMPNVLSTKIFQRHEGKWLLVHYHASQPHLLLPEASGDARASNPVASASDAADSVKAVDDEFYKAFGELDLDAMVKVWASSGNVTAIQPDFDIPFAGPKEVMESWQAIFRHNTTLLVISPSDAIQVAGNVGWSVGSYEFLAIRRDTGDTVHLPQVLVSKIFEKQGGNWHLVHYHAHIGPARHIHLQQQGGSLGASSSDGMSDGMR
jgi:ketosteroid isomerase-like protein